MKNQIKHLILLLAGLLLAGAAHATIYPVTTTDDGGPGSLRACIAAAQSGNDTIIFENSFNVPPSKTIVLTNELDITTNLTIVGPGAELLTINRGSLTTCRIFDISAGTTNIISGLMIAYGSPDGSGGGDILNAGVLTLINCSIINGTVSGGGGGISSSDSLTLINCVVSGNSEVSASGGGILASGPLTLVNCLIANNSDDGGNGGGIEADGPLAMTNCTVSYNSINGGDFPAGGGININSSSPITNILVNCTIASNSITGASDYGVGGGICLDGRSFCLLVSCTICGNSAGAGGLGGGISIDLGRVTLENTIVSGNIGVYGDLDAEYNITSGGFNLIGNGDGVSGNPWLASDQVGPKNGQPLDPILGPLQDNGGPTPTMAPTYLSVNVIDQGYSFGLNTDQRGQSRKFYLQSYPKGPQAANGDNSDIGAVELSYIPTLNIINVPNSSLINGTLAIGSSFYLTFVQMQLFGTDKNRDPFGGDSTLSISTNPPDFGFETITNVPGAGLGGGSSTWTASTKIVRYAGADHHFAMRDDVVPGSAFYRLNNTVPPPFIGPPITGSASNILTTTATLNGTDIPAGTNTVYWFVYGTDTNYGSTTLTNPLALSTDTMPVSADIGGLTPSTIYHFQLMVTDEEWGDQYGGDQTFTNLDPVPVVSTWAASAITTTSAALNGNVSAAGPDAVNAYFQYGTNQTDLEYTSTYFPPGDIYFHPYSFNVTDLTPNTTYYYQAVAFNNSHTAYGAWSNFTTLPIPIQSPPSVTTQGASSVTTSSAQLNGIVNPNGGNTTNYFEWGTNTLYGNLTALNPDGTTEQAVSASLPGLASSTTYYYRLDAANSGGLTLGSGTNFTTAWIPVPPTLGGPGTTTDTGYPVNTTQPTCTWTNIPQASSYGIVITAYPGNTVVYQNTGLVGTSFQIPGGYLTTGAGHGIEYSWTMTSFNSLGAQSAASTPLIFTDY